LLIRGIQMGEMSKLGWQIELVEHATWADYLHFLYEHYKIYKTKKID
jgi:hypothetical protein